MALRRLPGSDRDALNGATYIHEICTRVDPHYIGRATVPLLWDKQRKTIVNNEAADIVRMFDAGFGTLASRTFDLYPERLRADIDALNASIYAELNNGVYRAGFATRRWPTTRRSPMSSPCSTSWTLSSAGRGRSCSVTS